jgi:hypothetical protein
MSSSNLQQTQQQPPEDSIVLSIIEKFKSRSAVGWRKYGTTLDREDLSPLDWIQHAQEELMDGILYLEKLKKVYGSGLPATSLAPSAAAAAATAADTIAVGSPTPMATLPPP